VQDNRISCFVVLVCYKKRVNTSINYIEMETDTEFYIRIWNYKIDKKKSKKEIQFHIIIAAHINLKETISLYIYRNL